MRQAASTILVILGVACSSASPSSPSRTPATPADLTGNWDGTTFQGRTISFTVSRDRRLTALSVGYEIDSCSGIALFKDVDAPVFDIPATGAAGFAYGDTVHDRPDVGVGVQGFGMPDGSVWGDVTIYGKQACGTSEAIAGMFQATRRR